MEGGSSTEAERESFLPSLLLELKTKCEFQSLCDPSGRGLVWNFHLHQDGHYCLFTPNSTHVAQNLRVENESDDAFILKGLLGHRSFYVRFTRRGMSSATSSRFVCFAYMYSQANFFEYCLIGTYVIPQTPTQTFW